jgi:hypothetical protein
MFGQFWSLLQTFLVTLHARFDSFLTTSFVLCKQREREGANPPFVIYNYNANVVIG